MDFLNTSLFKNFYTLLLAVFFIIIMKILIDSAIESMKRTGGKWTSILDELLAGVIAFAVIMILAQTEPSTAVEMAMKPVKWLGGLILEFLRSIGIPL